MTLLSVHEVAFSWWPEVPLLQDVSFSLGAREALLLTGRNGSGKSTLLELVAGFRRPASGQLEIGGHRADRRAARRLRWFMEAQPALYRLLTVREQLEFYSAAHGERPDGVIELAEALTGPAVLDALCAELSTGQAQKVWFAASLKAHRAPLVLLDEPFSAIDAESVPVMLQVLEEFRAAGGAVVLVTHPHRGLIPSSWRELRVGEQAAPVHRGVGA